MRRTKEEAAATRRQVMEAALRMFSQNGYAATTLDDIAREAGVTRGAIYWHFSNKADLYNTLVAEVFARVNPTMEQAMQDGGSVLEGLRRLFVGTLAYLEEDEVFRLVNEMILFKTAVTPEMEPGMQKKMHATRAMVDTIAGMVQSGIQAGEIRADVDARDAALSLLGCQNGLAALWLLDPALFCIKDRAEALADIYIAGIAAR
jgi:TetR/AcrR family acrAB operon transcriptional repressor